MDFQGGIPSSSLVSCLDAKRDCVSKSSVPSLQKFGDQSVAQIEHMRRKHRIRVLQGHEDTTKQNVVSRGPLSTPVWQRGAELGWVHLP